MQLMQYEITLPADYDMGIIRHRVATRGSRTDDFPDLGAQGIPVRERGRHGSPVNQYAPFYLWAGHAGMNQFLFGPAFDGIRADFGRPAVRTWQTVGRHRWVRSRRAARRGHAQGRPCRPGRRASRPRRPGRRRAGGRCG